MPRSALPAVAAALLALSACGDSGRASVNNDRAGAADAPNDRLERLAERALNARPPDNDQPPDNADAAGGDAPSSGQAD